MTTPPALPRRFTQVRFACVGSLLLLVSAGIDVVQANAQSQPAAESSLAERASSVEIAAVDVGFANRYKVGCWTPVRVAIRRTGKVRVALEAELVAHVNDGDGVEVAYPAAKPVRLDEEEIGVWTLYVRFGHLTSPLRLELRTGGETLLQRTFDSSVAEGQRRYLPPALPSSEQILLNIGELDLPTFLRQIRSQAHLASLADTSALPDHWCGYESVDLLILSAADPDLFSSLVDPQRQAALSRWVQLGGRVVVVAGAEQLPQITAADHPLATLVPGKFVGPQTLRRTTAIEGYSGLSTPLLSPTATRTLQVPEIEVAQGVVELRQDQYPLIIRTSQGLGLETFVALPLYESPLANWPARSAFLRRLLQLPPALEEETTSRMGQQVSHSGITDLAGQLRGALDQFEGVSLAPFLLISLLSLCYILLIGPVDYFFLKNVLRNMQWTWITFPTLVVVFCAIAYGMANSMKGSSLRLNQADVVDVDVANGLVRGTTWFNVFSPSTAQYNITVRGQLPDNQTAQEEDSLVSWMGLPGSALGGMETGGLNAALIQGAYQSAQQREALNSVPVPVWSSKSFTARWSSTSTVAPSVKLTAESDGVPDGQIHNTLDVPLKQCLLVVGRWAYALDEFKPDERLTINRRTPRREIQNQLTGRTIQFSTASRQYESRASQYDVLSFDIPMILQQMMFYEAAGGERYTRLLNQYQNFIDLSDQLDTNRAILIGFVDRPGSHIQVDDRAAHEMEHHQYTTCYRFIYPVLPSKPDDS